jgi:hypothetical protein
MDGLDKHMRESEEHRDIETDRIRELRDGWRLEGIKKQAGFGN